MFFLKLSLLLWREYQVLGPPGCIQETENASMDFDINHRLFGLSHVYSPPKS